MRRRKVIRKNFGLYIAAGAIVFLLNILGLYDQEQQNTETRVETQSLAPLTEDTMRVHFLDVNQGLSILVQLGDEVLIYDGGESDTSSFVVAYLKDQGITEIDYLISSHYDSDHVSGLIGCLYAFDVKNVIGSDYMHESNRYSSFMRAVKEEGLEVQHPCVGTQYFMGGAIITILAPAEITSDSNSNSVVIKLTYGESDFIFTGDADYKSERDMIASGIDLDCEILSVGHHGSATATSEAFVDVTTPEYAIISCEKSNSYGHPHKETLEILDEYQVEILRNDELGTIVVDTDGTEFVWIMGKSK